MTSSNIALTQLTVSQHNVRVATPDKAAHKRLMASIASQGVLQNLVVVPTDAEHFEVIAGGRRLRALQALAKDDTIAADFPVPCLVATDTDNITAISLAENVGHEPMHPADEYLAFAKLLGEGKGIEEVAASFGVTRSVVEKRIKLGQVAPKILNAYRKGDLNLDAVMAFTVCNDHERQLACYQELQDRAWPMAIKQWLLGEAIDAKRGIGAFVGKAAYINAGGAVSGDLFEDTVYLSDATLVSELAQAKLERAQKKLTKASPDWKWVTTALDRHTARDGLVQLTSQYIGVPPELTEKMEALQAQILVWDDLYCDEKRPEEFETDDDFEAAMEAAQQALEALDDTRDEYLAFTPEQQGYSGCIVTFDHTGKLEVLEGLAQRKDIPTQNSHTSGEEGEGGSDSVSHGDGAEGSGGAGVAPISQALLTDLGAYRQQIVQANLLANPAVAADVLHYSLCVQILSPVRYGSQSLQHAHFDVVSSNTKLDDTKEGRAFDAFEKARAALSLEWLEHEDAGERFGAFCALNKRAKDKLVAFCTAQSLTIGPQGSARDQEALIDTLKIDFAQYWRPTTTNYLSRLNKAQLLDQFGPLLGDEWADAHRDDKKGVLIEHIAKQIQEAGEGDAISQWVPVQF